VDGAFRTAPKFGRIILSPGVVHGMTAIGSTMSMPSKNSKQEGGMSDHAYPQELRRVLGVAVGIAIVVGGTIGAGILRTPGIIAATLGHPALILGVWIAGGLLAAMGANCYAELATMLPRAGGPYVFARRAFGEFAGFGVGWADWTVSVCALAALSVPCGEYAARLFPPLAGHEHAIAVGVILTLSAVNWFGLEVGGRAQNVLSLAKVIGLLVIVIGCFMYPDTAASSGSSAHSFTAPLILAFVPLMYSMQIMSETYAGWNSSVYLSEEDRDAPRNVPRALFWGVLAVTATYLAVNVGLLVALPFETLATSALPVADAARILFGGAADRSVTALAMVSVLGTLNVIVMYTPRIIFALGRDGLVPRRAGRLNRSAVPGIALLLTAVPSVLLASGGSFELLFSMTGFLGVAVNAAIYLAYFALRRSEPNLARPYRAFGHPLLPGLVAVISVGLLVGFVVGNPMASLFSVALLAASYPVYQLLRRRLKDE
jgi:APA family basic amino acid/polyamine antiporter